MLPQSPGGTNLPNLPCLLATSTLLGSTATGMFINGDFVQKHWLETTPLPQPRVRATHLCYLNPLAEAGRGGSSPMSPSVQKCHPGTLQGLCRHLLREGLCPPPPLQSMGSCHRSPP